MAQSQSEVETKVRNLTDYDTTIIDDSDLDGLVGLAEDEIIADTGETGLQFYQGTDTHNLDLAVMWLTCLFAKIKTGEIEGPTLSLGELRAASLSGQSSIWMERLERALHRFGDFRGFGSTNVTRDNRTYGESF